MIPDMTALQFFVLRALIDGELSGRDLRERLASEGEKKSLAAFYQLMGRLEEAKFVEGSYVTKVIDGQTVKERRYKISGVGTRAWERAREFYVAKSAIGFVGAPA